jgi:hypothetical protein
MPPRARPPSLAYGWHCAEINAPRTPKWNLIGTLTTLRTPKTPETGGLDIGAPGLSWFGYKGFGALRPIYVPQTTFMPGFSPTETRCMPS